MRVSSHGLRTGSGCEVKLAPEKHRSSHTASPTIVAPSASRQRTAVASRRGTNPSTVREPFIIGTPATATLSLIATVRPANGPPEDSVIEVVTYHAAYGLSDGAGDSHDRCGTGSALRAYSRSTATEAANVPSTAGANSANPASDRPNPKCGSARPADQGPGEAATSSDLHSARDSINATRTQHNRAARHTRA